MKYPHLVGTTGTSSYAEFYKAHQLEPRGARPNGAQTHRSQLPFDGEADVLRAAGGMW